MRLQELQTAVAHLQSKCKYQLLGQRSSTSNQIQMDADKPYEILTQQFNYSLFELSSYFRMVCCCERCIENY